MAVLEFVFRIQPAVWDFGTAVGTQNVLCYHQYIGPTGEVADHTDPAAGTWEPFIPGPVIRGQVGDTVRVTIQNRIDASGLQFVDTLKTGAIVHWHGIELSAAHDGTPVTQKPIAEGGDFIYQFELPRAGVFWYHPHFDGLIQEHLGCYGAIIVEDTATDELRAAKIIPHSERSFNICLSDVSFQDSRSATSGVHVPLANMLDPGPKFIRDLEPASQNENLGDILLVNGKHNAPFNHANGNFQQFWANGERLTAAPITLNEEESVELSILNTGLHRFYKIYLMFREGAGPWTKSNDLIWIGGQGGLLDEAHQGGGEFGQFRIRARKSREVGQGADAMGQGVNAIQVQSELEPGEHLLVTSARITLAFEAQIGWTEAEVRVSGFGAIGQPSITADADPAEMTIARFDVGTTLDDTFKLDMDLMPGTALRTNPALSAPTPQTDLSIVPAVTSFTGCDKPTLQANGVPVPTGPLMTDYAITLDQSGGGPGLNGEQVMWMPTGPAQPTPNSTRYINAGDVVEMTVETTTPGTDHPFHMHGMSFQPIRMELNDGSGGYTVLYDWDFTEYVDSIYVPTQHRLTFRFHADARNYIAEDHSVAPNGVVGRWLAHCHITKHAHRGMMTNFIVVDGCSFNQLQMVDLYLRDNVGDNGAEPSTGSISASPDIIVRPNEVLNPNDAFGTGSTVEDSTTLGFEAEFGQDNYIYARVSNRGNQPGNAKTDVYWSQVSTLVTPDMWNYIGRTNTHLVPANGFEVSDTLVWPEPDVPPTGHYCYVGVTSSDQDPMPITPAGAANFAAFADFDDFRAFIRENNNVTWRNFNVVDDVAMLTSSFVGGFQFVGAFDQSRKFDLVFRNPFRRLIMEFAADEDLLFALKKQDARFEVNRRTAQVFIPQSKEFRFKELPFAKKKPYRAKLFAEESPEKYIGEQLWVAQEHVANYERDLKRLQEQDAEIRKAISRNRNEKAQPLVRKREALLRNQMRLNRFINVARSDGRMEVGRVTWDFQKPRKDPPKAKIDK